MAREQVATTRTALCCFCAQYLSMEATDAYQLTISRPGFNGNQGWFAHEECLASALHQRAQFERDIYWQSD